MMGRSSSTVLAPIAAPALDTFKRHERDLVTWEFEAEDDRGRPVARLYPLPAVTGYTKLIPETDCAAIIAEIEAALAPACVEIGMKLARRVLGRYTAREFIDAEVFVAESTRVFAEAPADLGEATVDKLRSRKFPPNTGDILEVLSPLVEARRRALRQVRAHVAEHERRRGRAPEEVYETIRRFKSLAPAIEATVGAQAFALFWPTLWVVADDGKRLVVAQPTSMLRDWTAPHLLAIAAATGREVELVVRSTPAPGSRKTASGPRSIGEVVAGGSQ